MASNAAAENETDRLKAEIGSLRDRVDHLQTTMEEFRTRYSGGPLFSAGYPISAT
jgi:hypothetical protein